MIFTPNGWKWNVESLEATKQDLPSRLRVINKESDFKVQDSTTITLKAGYRYLIGSPIITSKRFIVEDGVDLSAIVTSSLMLTYTSVRMGVLSQALSVPTR